MERNPVAKDGAQSRRSFLSYFSGIGLSSTLMPGLLWGCMQEAEEQEVTLAMTRTAAQVAGLDFSDEELEMIVDGVNQSLERFEEIRAIPLENSVMPPLHFIPMVSGMEFDHVEGSLRLGERSPVTRPADLEDVAFWPVTDLAQLIESRQVQPSELTEMYISRLNRYNPTLNCVVTLTESRARTLAEQADTEIAEGRYRGPLHGIPWGAKDIISARGYPTTWGAAPFENQEFDLDATVVERLDEAGAILVAKLTTGELAFGDNWFGGRTNNPWDPEQGSSGSSAGSGSATAAGLVGFAIGTDTGGSILSPAVRCGVVGLRPTFGRVSRYGVMAAGYSLDKIGPMCRTAEDCAVVLHAIVGPDGKDMSVPRGVPFNWDGGADLSALRIGYFASAFEEEQPRQSEEDRANAEATLSTLRGMGFSLEAVEIPRNDLTYFIEYVERAAGFAEFARSGQDQGLRRQNHRGELRVSQLVPAVEYLQANRIRMLLMEELAQALDGIDVLVAPWRSINPLTSMTGHPVVAVPNGFTGQVTPTGIAFMGSIYGENTLLALAKAYQEATGFHERHPAL
ncbi:MAG: amidase [Gammaproteobacteria bacterium]|nr:MAG: amidase [Gammaproteobacteria bacterium]